MVFAPMLSVVVMINNFKDLDRKKCTQTSTQTYHRIAMSCYMFIGWYWMYLHRFVRYTHHFRAISRIRMKVIP